MLFFKVVSRFFLSKNKNCLFGGLTEPQAFSKGVVLDFSWGCFSNANPNFFYRVAKSYDLSNRGK